MANVSTYRFGSIAQQNLTAACYLAGVYAQQDMNWINPQNADISDNNRAYVSISASTGLTKELVGLGSNLVLDNGAPGLDDAGFITKIEIGLEGYKANVSDIYLYSFTKYNGVLLNNACTILNPSNIAEATTWIDITSMTNGPGAVNWKWSEIISKLSVFAWGMFGFSLKGAAPTATSGTLYIDALFVRITWDVKSHSLTNIRNLMTQRGGVSADYSSLPFNTRSYKDLQAVLNNMDSVRRSKPFLYQYSDAPSGCVSVDRTGGYCPSNASSPYSGPMQFRTMDSKTYYHRACTCDAYNASPGGSPYCYCVVRAYCTCDNDCCRSRTGSRRTSNCSGCNNIAPCACNGRLFCTAYHQF